jgi:hypothetical protein
MRSAVDEETQCFKLTWTESGRPAVREPARRSFRTRVIIRLRSLAMFDLAIDGKPEAVP